MNPEQAEALLWMLEAHGEGLCGAAYSAIRALQLSIKEWWLNDEPE